MGRSMGRNRLVAVAPRAPSAPRARVVAASRGSRRGNPVRKLSPPKAVRRAMELAERERRFLVAEMVKTKGLLPVLMKRRNKQRWTSQDKAEIRAHLERLSKLSPYLVVVVMPGGFAILPALAWWLDRRRQKRSRAVTA